MANAVFVRGPGTLTTGRRLARIGHCRYVKKRPAPTCPDTALSRLSAKLDGRVQVGAGGAFFSGAEWGKRRQLEEIKTRFHRQYLKVSEEVEPAP